MEFFDSHAHYCEKEFEQDRNELILQIYKEGISRIINAGYNIESSKKAVMLANNYDYIYATAGISPNDIDQFEEKDLEEIEILAKSKKVVAIGEIGLDYHWNVDNKELQKKVFISQIELANKLQLPIVIHTRDAIFDTLDILKNKKECTKKGVFHCTPLNIDLIREGLKLGFYISFAGPITFKNSKNATEAIKTVPIDRILIETDSPFLSPEPLRGKRNDSRNVKYMAQKIAEVKNMSIEDIAKATYENANRIFNI